MAEYRKVRLSTNRGLELPSEILFAKILPLLDRATYNNLATTCRDLHKALLESPSDLPPWPSRLVSDDHLGSVKSFAFAPSGRVIAGGYSDGSVRLWQIYSGEQKPLHGHCPREVVHSIVFGRTNDCLLATASSDHTIMVWNLDARQTVGSRIRVTIHSPNDPQRIHAAHVSCLRFSPDDTMLLSAHSSSETINFWSVSTGSWIKTLVGPLSRVSKMEISRNGKHLVATAHGDDDTSNYIRVWNVHDSSFETKGGGFHNVLAESTSSQDSFMVASVYRPDSFHLWISAFPNNKRRRKEYFDQTLLERGVEHRRFSNAYPHELAFSTDGSKVASVDDFRSIKIWRTRDGKLLSTVHELDALSLYAMSVCPHSRTIGTIARTRVGRISRNQNVVRLFHLPRDEDTD